MEEIGFLITCAGVGPGTTPVEHRVQLRFAHHIPETSGMLCRRLRG